MIIGLGYKARSGKSTVAKHITAFYGFANRGFADSLKEACKVIFRLSDRQLYGDLKEEIDPFWGTTPRDMFQRVGTEALRQGFNQDIWVDSLKKYISTQAQYRGDNWVIPDVRFPNEAFAIKKMGGRLVRIDREDRDEISTGHKHASEISMEQYKDWDYVIDNNQSLEQLDDCVHKMMKELNR